MSNSISYTDSQTFSVTHARYLASKVATDLKRIQRFYSSPSDKEIADYEQELIALLKEGYFSEILYGFKREGKFIEPTLRYTAAELSNSSGMNDDPGKVKPWADISNSHFTSFLTYSGKWSNLSENERENFKRSLAIQRVTMPTPETNGFFQSDRIYSAGGQSLNRSSLQSY